MGNGVIFPYFWLLRWGDGEGYAPHVDRNRTAKRNRWSVREEQGGWGSWGEGTRENGTVTSGEGGPARVKNLLRKPRRVEGTRPLQRFIKNIARCNQEAGR